MAVEIRVPPLGESLVEATVGPWLVKEGEPVTAGQPVVELETEKVNLQVSADVSGVLERILKPTGETVHVDEVLATVAAGARPAVSAPSAPVSAPPAATGQPPPAAPPSAPPPAPVTPAAPAPSEEEQRVTSVARQMAAEHGIDLSAINGTGPAGRVTKTDVEHYLEQHLQRQQARAATAVPPRPLETAPLPTEVGQPGRPEKRVRLSRRRLTIARHLLEAQRDTASLTTFNEVDMKAVMDFRRRRKEDFEKRHGVSLGLMSFFVKAAVAALKAFPEVNSEIQGEDLLEKYFYDIGIAVDTPAGLVVPVLRDANEKSFAEIEKGIGELARRARENQLTLEELRGGTFTITNGGVFGSLLSTPIINPPQAAILGMHRIVERPVAVNGQVEIRPMMYLALTYDHRIIDGRTAVQFLVRIKNLIEDPEQLLLDT
ncbi:MAG TPA: 2-oxoglutarate dehydrogenase complex dihydrolipoyllysine-residue succinyltransferase [Chloroflexota bacterium]|nr:2-oxoglutarate dehydrogenase complex dihydrolipoyllysine-residue succinyltransferase [Chloroflexota bacterium]